MHKPSAEQQKIINEPSHCVVIARPGSGKTFTLARKIERILKELPEHKGVAAISFTNKASDELKRRCLANGVPKRAAFFGTIDKFFISELVSFLPHVLHRAPVSDYKITKLSDLPSNPFDGLINTTRLTLETAELAEVSRLYGQGIIPLELIGKLGVFVFDNSIACRRYLKARYRCVAIDEYQDSGFEQHQLFLRLKELGIVSIAVGDLDQSIYAFSHKSSEFLTSLTQDKDFKLYPLTKNHRCHESIIYYSLRLISAAVEADPPKAIRVYGKNVVGAELEIAMWLNEAIPKCKEKLSIKNNNEFAVLFRSNSKGSLISEHLTIPHKLFASTPFDEDNSLWGGVFRRILGLLFDTNANKFDMVEEYLNIDYDPKTAKKCLSLLRELQELSALNLLSDTSGKFQDIARLIYPNAENKTAVEALTAVLTSKDGLLAFVPARKDQLQLMTLHKAKGLEFEIVFHLDLYQYIIPGFNAAVKGDITELTQDLNLHYVGVTRAKQAVVLCTSSRRTNSAGKVLDGTPSAFLSRNGVDKYRTNIP